MADRGGSHDDDSDGYWDDASDWGDEGDSLSALDFGVADSAGHDSESGLDAIADYSTVESDTPDDIAVDSFGGFYNDAQQHDAQQHDDTAQDSFGPSYEPEPEAGEPQSESPFPMFTVTNPPGTISVTAAMSGQVQLVELMPETTRLTEAELAHEILAAAAIATKKAQAGLHDVVFTLLVEQGLDNISARNFVEFGMQLPTREQAAAAEADFAAGYRR